MTAKERAEPRVHARREFMRLTLSAIPATAMLAGCVNASDSAFEGAADGPALAEEPELLFEGASADEESERRTRWVQLHAAYIGAENKHDVPAIMQCFASEACMLVNEQPFHGSEAIASVHASLGMSSTAVGLAGTQVVHDREFFTEHELLIHGRVLGLHVGQVLQFPPTFRQVELHYASIYRYDDEGKISSERLVINLAPLAS